jgi:D-lactate dehydrogenase (cytochrome)
MDPLYRPNHMSARIRARAPYREAPAIVKDPDVVREFLADAAHVPGGSASAVAFPRSSDEVAAVVRGSTLVHPVGAQSSLTGGATPRGGIVLSTRQLKWVSRRGADRVRAGAGATLAALQQTLAADQLYYPPVPTFDGATVGGVIATNAAGAATFKYGSTRPWVEWIEIVLADGSIVELRRGETIAREGVLEIERTNGTVTRVPLPTYLMPAVAKHSGGYAASPVLDAIDLFIGSEGTLGVITQAELRVIRRPRIALALVPCASDADAIAITSALCRRKGAVAGVEYMDGAALAQVPDYVFHRTAVPRPPPGSVLLLVQVEGSLDSLTRVLERYGVADAAVVAMAGDTRAAERLLDLREAVPASVNARVADAKAHVDAAIEKTAGDMIVPFDRLAESLALYRNSFNARGLEHAIWGHFSDGNLHPNVIPRSLDDVKSGKEALLEIGRAIVAMGGSPLAEHGVGRNPVKQELLRQMYGNEGIEQMRAVKRALDPEWKLAPGVLFPP